MVKTLLNENTTGDIISKRWHLMALMLKIISKLQFACIYIWLVPYTGLLFIIAIVIVVVLLLLSLFPINE